MEKKRVRKEEAGVGGRRPENQTEMSAEDEGGPRTPGCCVIGVSTACPLCCGLGGLCGMAQERITNINSEEKMCFTFQVTVWLLEASPFCLMYTITM